MVSEVPELLRLFIMFRFVATMWPEDLNLYFNGYPPGVAVYHSNDFAPLHLFLKNNEFI